VPQGEPKGVKQQGGVLDVVHRQIEIECLPADIPTHIEVDVSELMVGMSIRVKDLATNPKWKTVTDQEVMLLHVIERIEHLDTEFDELKPFYDRLAKSARKGLLEFSERFVADSVKVVDAIMYGKRTQEIVRFAIENNADLIIMASHRIDPDRPGHDWSSISYVVAILAPCPVLLAK